MDSNLLEPQVIFEDPNLIVLAKPAGLLSQGEATGDENLVDWLRQRLGRPYVGLVHRLDRNTSGIMVVAKRSKAANRLTESLQAGDLHRSYLAWVHGTLDSPRRFEHFLLKDERTNIVRVVPRGTRGAKEAALKITPRAKGTWEGAPLTLAELVLETGRSHQIRVQCASEGHPLLGDVKYRNRFTPPHSELFGRPALHSHRIDFPHPIGGAPLKFEAELPSDMIAIPATPLKR